MPTFPVPLLQAGWPLVLAGLVSACAQAGDPARAAMPRSSLVLPRVADARPPVPATVAGHAADRPVAPTGPAAGPSPVAAIGSSGSATGAGASPEPLEPLAARDGLVRLAVAAGEGPALAGVRVQAFGASPAEAVTDEQGRFALPASAGDELLLTLAGHAPSLVIGWRSQPLTLHLASPYEPAPAPEALVPVEGVVLREDGQPAAGAVVSGGDGRGTAFGPLTTDAMGRFVGQASSRRGERPDGLAVWALTRSARRAVTALGFLADAAIGEGAPALTLRLAEPTDRVTFAEAPPSGKRQIALLAQADNGMAITLQRWGAPDATPVGQYFDVPGMRLVAEVSVTEAAQGKTSTWRAAVSGPGRLAPSLLPMPQAPAWPVAAREGDRLSWPAVPGATGYRLALRQAGAPVPVWEAYTPTPGLPLRGLPAERADELELTAFQGAGLREVASVSAPRRLRWPTAPPVDRHATHVVPL